LDNGKKRVGLYGFTGCNGDQLTIIHSEDKLLDFFGSAEIKSFSLAKSDNDNTELDIALVEGSISNQEQAEQVKEIRERTKFLVAIGNCSCYGGIQAMELGGGGCGPRSNPSPSMYSFMWIFTFRGVPSTRINFFIVFPILSATMFRRFPIIPCVPSAGGKKTIVSF
jgi:hypothetical protein